MILASLFAAAVFFSPPRTASDAEADAKAQATVASAIRQRIKGRELEKGILGSAPYLGTRAVVVEAVIRRYLRLEFRGTETDEIRWQLWRAGPVVARQQGRATQSARASRLRAVLSTQIIGAFR